MRFFNIQMTELMFFFKLRMFLIKKRTVLILLISIKIIPSSTPLHMTNTDSQNLETLFITLMEIFKTGPRLRYYPKPNNLTTLISDS